jgi:ABC-type phosphate transport system substrate-binding protein
MVGDAIQGVEESMKALTLIGAATLVFAGVTLAPAAGAQVIKIDGSSTVFPITEARSA